MRKSWHLKNKWQRHLALSRGDAVRRYLPETALLNIQTARKFLDRYQVVFIKPVFGSYGNGVAKISRTKRSYRVQSGLKVKYFDSRTQVIKTMLKLAGSKKFLIQQGIDLLSVNQRPIDFRVMYFKPYNRWLNVGIAGKVAAPNKIVTNYRNGGSFISLKQALRRTNYPLDKHFDQVNREIRNVCRNVAFQFGGTYRKSRRLGIDIGVDKQLKPWILEINTRPQYELFRHHPNKRLYHTIDKFTNHIIKMN